VAALDHPDGPPDALDNPGEWYLERKTGILTYWPKPGEDLRNAEMIAPELQQLLVLKGDVAANKPVHNVVLRGLTFSYTDWPLGPNGYADSQAAIAVRGHLFAEGAVDCAFEDCTFSHLGGYGIDLGRGCQRCKIIGNELFDLAAGGIRIGETKIPRDPADQNFGHLITDNHRLSVRGTHIPWTFDGPFEGTLGLFQSLWSRPNRTAPAEGCATRARALWLRFLLRCSWIGRIRLVRGLCPIACSRRRGLRRRRRRSN